MIEYILSGGTFYGYGFGTWLAIAVLILIVLGLARHFLTSGPAGH
ncbi:hypothetical protein [Lutibaculum baratangense]|uniref:Uncharacterized protein n=1 Tax=Lutibaculum baratangense AMV1 TaxID=631454 RepID=V4QTU2_9HYPH|nr:hypothetical protein [Lutibaculum baratangense]ESR23192.1 hypothetical protein N177_3260 [Lutibaculum baratangense AMV1]